MPLAVATCALAGGLVSSSAVAANDVRLLIVEAPGNVMTKNGHDLLRAALGEVVERQGLRVVPPRSLPDKLLRCELPDCLPQIAAASGATYLLGVKAKYAKESFKLAIELWHTEQGKLLGSGERNCPICDEQDLYVWAADLTDGLLTKALRATSTEPPQAVAVEVPAAASPVLVTQPARAAHPATSSIAPLVVGVAAAVAGLSALLVGVYYLHVDGQHACSRCDDLRDTRKFGLPMTIGGGAALLVGAGLVGWHLWPNGDTGATVSLLPTGVQLTGRFQ